MLYEDNNFLIHYGIKGMHWGVRRFQNADGSLTKAGRDRYRVSSGSLDSAKRYVQKRVSNQIEPIHREKIDISEVQKRGRLSRKEAEQCAELAADLYEKASKVEPEITKDVVSAVAQSGGSMYGLDYRLKQPTSLAAKIGQDAKEGKQSFEKAANGVNDAIRYTSVTEDDNFTTSYEAVKKKLDDKGYAEIKCKNYFEQFRDGLVKHKSVQSIFEDIEGNRFEMQFHTPSSQAVKNQKIPLYEERRKSGVSEERKRELEQQMSQLADYISDPKGVFGIKAHTGVDSKTQTGKIHSMKEKLKELEYSEYTKLQTPKETARKKSGSCHDQVLFEVDELRKAGLDPKALFVMEHSGSKGGMTHSLAYFMKNGKTYWVENAWSERAGIKGYKNLDEIKREIKKAHKSGEFGEKSKFSELSFGDFNLNQQVPGESLQELVNHIRWD